MKSNYESEYRKIIDNCSEYCHPISNQSNDDNILNFIVFIGIFSQLSKESIIQYQCDQIKKRSSFVYEVSKKFYYIKVHFWEIGPYILNEIELKTIEKAALISQDKNGCQENFLYKILSHKDD